MRKIIIDTDPGVDDAFAIIAALLYDDFELLGVCSVAGNKGINITTDNALKVLKLMNSDVKVYKGATRPINADKDMGLDSSSVHGKNGLGNAELDFDYTNLADEEAGDFIVRMAKEHKGELEIFTVGPMTNLAIAVEKDREAMEGVKAIYSMGGGIHSGNVTPVAEFNYWYDPESVEIVYSLGNKVDIYMFGLDITHKVIFDLNDLFFIQKECGELGKVLYDMASIYLDTYWNLCRYTGCVIHDLLTVLFAIDVSNEVFPKSGIKKCNMRISKEGISVGQTVVDLIGVWGLEENAYMVLDVDVKKCKKLLISLLSPEKVDMYEEYVLK